MKIIKFFTIILISFFLIACTPHSSRTADQTSNEKNTADYFEKIKNNPSQLALFLAAMPKGGDLHNHLSGAVYAEDIIKFASNDGFCINPKTLDISKVKNCPSDLQLKNLKNNYDLYNSLVNYWSYRSFARSEKEERLNFFDSFLRSVAAVDPHTGEILANLLHRYGQEHLTYVELQELFDTPELLQLASKVPPNDNFSQAREYLMTHGAQTLVDHMQTHLSQWMAAKDQLLKCGTPQADPGCNVTPRFQFIALRAMPAQMVYAQLVIGFMLADQNPLVVAVNMVGPEDAPLTLENYTKQMHMVAYLHALYPTVKISLHAGELMPGLVPPESLNSHIRQALLLAGADRIGHGSDIAYEQDSQQTLDYMAKHHIAVEECLTSNAQLLNLTGNHHPILLYLKNHVPVTLNTDDEGVLRTDLNVEYERAVLTYQFSYTTVKMFARNSLTYSFMSGMSLWKDAENAIPNTACANDILGAKDTSSECTKFLERNPKANLQWQLESQFNSFEAEIALSHRNSPYSHSQ